MYHNKSLSAAARPWQPGAPAGFFPGHNAGQGGNPYPPAMFTNNFQQHRGHGMPPINAPSGHSYFGGGSNHHHHHHHQQQQQQAPKISKTAAKLFVGQLPFECDDQRLKELFGAYGTVEQIHILKDSENRSKGAAFITYSNVEEADTAIFTLHNRYRMLTNRAIQVSYAKNSPNISPFGSYNAMEVATLNPSNPVPDVAVTSTMPPNNNF